MRLVFLIKGLPELHITILLKIKINAPKTHKMFRVQPDGG